MNKRYPAVKMATALIPWDINNNFMTKIFDAQINHMIEGGINHIYLFGTAGEGYAINNRQFNTIVKRFSELMASDSLYPMVGLIDTSVARIKEKLEIAYSYGIRRFQFSLPSWSALSKSEISTFFDALLPDYKDCLFLNYNLARTKRLIEPNELFELAKRHPNFAAVKQTRCNEADLQAIADSKTPLQFFVTEQNFLKLSKLTECGLLMSITNVDLTLASSFFNAVQTGNFKKAYEIISIFKDIRSKMTDLITFPTIDGVYDKLYTKFNLPEFPLRLLPPYQYASDQVFKQFAKNTKRILTAL